MTTPARHWRTYGNNYPLPTGAEALDEPFAAFSSWFMRLTCERCGQERMFNEVHHSAQHGMLIPDILDKMRHDGCGGRMEGGVAHRHRGVQPAVAEDPARDGLSRAAKMGRREGTAISRCAPRSIQCHSQARRILR